MSLLNTIIFFDFKNISTTIIASDESGTSPISDDEAYDGTTTTKWVLTLQEEVVE